MIAHGCAKAYAAGMTISLKNNSGSVIHTVNVTANNIDLTLLLKANNVKGFGFWVGTTAVVVLDVNQPRFVGASTGFSVTTSTATDSVPFEYVWDYNITAILAKVTS